ncbi:MAG: hypothetical protein KKF12_12505 [Proteobacteria bacterium]|nr:hypothetical protein [Desulfobacula sp.]MBU4131633.1 hypothetical protein [Pseudomonadota bacterium]
MSIIKNGIYFGKDQKKKGFYKKQNLSAESISLLKRITPRQHKKFKSEKNKMKKLIPWQLLQVFWELGFLPIIEKPQAGMRLKSFLDLLSYGDYKDKGHQYKCVWLRDKIYDEEFPSPKREPAIFVGINNTNLLPVSHLRTIPGTIYK